MVWSPDGTLLATAVTTDNGDIVILLDAATGQTAAVLEGYEDLVWSIAWSPGGRWLASGDRDERVKEWEAGQD